MKALGALLVLLGIACFILPLLGVSIPFLIQLGATRTIFSIILILIGMGLFFFSGYE